MSRLVSYLLLILIPSGLFAQKVDVGSRDLKGKKPPVSAPDTTARKVQPGDLVIIVSYAIMDFDDAKDFTPWILFPDEKNKLR